MGHSDSDAPDKVAVWLERIRSDRDEDARSLVEHLYPLVIKIVRAHRPRRIAEEDLAQDVFMKLFGKLDQFRGSVPFEHWVSRVAVNTCRDQLRAQRVRPELRWADLSEAEAAVLDNRDHSIDSTPHPAHILGARELVDKLLARLSPEDRFILQMLDMEERSVDEIRSMTGWTASLIKVRAFRARRNLRAYLEKLETERS